MTTAPLFRSYKGVKYKRAEVKKEYNSLFRQIAKNGGLKAHRFKGHLYIEIKKQA